LIRFQSEKLLLALHKDCQRLIPLTSIQGLLKLASHTDVMLKIAEYLLPEYLTLDAEESLLPEEAEPFSIASEPF
jgi:hypothetical protein